MKEEWLFPGAVVPVDVETTAALVAEIKRLIDVVGGMALKAPVLQDIEQYRLQMAGISTAAIGYWKEIDSIHPDYDTLALRDVAQLYAKYDALYKAQDVSHGMIAGVLFDFMAWLTSRPKRIMLSSVDDASPAVDAIKDFAKLRGLSLDDAQVQNWQEALAKQPAPVAEPRKQEPVAYWNVNGGFSHCMIDKLDEAAKHNPAPLYTSPPQRTWVGLTHEEHMKTVIEMAQEAGFEFCNELTWESVICTEELERFAGLVRADAIADAITDERENGQKWFDAVTAQHKQLILAEREACASYAENYDLGTPEGHAIATAIRARGNI